MVLSSHKKWKVHTHLILRGFDERSSLLIEVELGGGLLRVRVCFVVDRALRKESIKQRICELLMPDLFEVVEVRANQVFLNGLALACGVSSLPGAERMA